MNPKPIDAVHWIRRTLTLGTILIVVGVAAIAATDSAALAQPASTESSNPYPELRYFSKIDAEPFRLPGQGIWFVTAQGLHCGIWWRGSFGCTGNIPGAPPDVHHVGWYAGDTRVHYDWTMAVRFPPSRGTLSIPPLSYIESEGTMCATTIDAATYCERGPWRLLITPTHTWLNG